MVIELHLIVEASFHRSVYSDKDAVSLVRIVVSLKLKIRIHLATSNAVVNWAVMVYVSIRSSLISLGNEKLLVVYRMPNASNDQVDPINVVTNLD